MDVGAFFVGAGVRQKVMRAFNTAVNSSGFTDIILPAGFEGGERNLILIPPDGHAYTFKDPSGNTVSLPMDFQLPLRRSYLQAPFSPGDKLGSIQLDSGSGNARSVAS